MTSCMLIPGRDDYKRPWRLPCSSSLALSVLGGHSDSTAYQVSLLYNWFGYRTWPTSRTLRSASMWSCHYSCIFSYNCLTFLTFRSRLFGVAGHAETFPSFSVIGPFIPVFPGFQVPSDSIVPLSSSKALPLHLQLCNCSDVFSFISSFNVPEPFQHSLSRNRRYRFHLCLF